MDNTTSHPSNRPIPPSLRPLALGSSYCLLRGLAWSPDAELAVASDDSVHVFVPRLIGSDGNPISIVDTVDSADSADASGAEPGRNGDVAGARSSSPGGALLDDFATDTETRGQFAAHSRHIPVGAMPVPKGINSRLRKLRTPLLDAILASQLPAQPAQSTREATPARQAKGSLLRGTWGVTNSVVEMAWSPTGVGRHSRSVLGVLTSSGMLVVYGERLDGRDNAGGGGSSIRGRGRQNYDTSQWEILWAAGTSAPVVGQEQSRRAGDRIISFAWTGKWEGPSFFHDQAAYADADADVDAGAGADAELAEASLRSLLVYMTDQDEIVVLAVLHVRGSDGAVDWQVMEAARRTVTRPAASDSTAPLGQESIYDTASGVQCSSWFIDKTEAGPYEVGKHAQTCLVGYIAGSYVGFLRITVQLPRPGEPAGPFVHLDDNVTNGVCMDLLPGAFLRFEEGVWAVNDVQPKPFLCRAVVATPMTVNELELEIETRGPGGAPVDGPAAVLPAQKYPAADAGDCTNPITGLVVHPPNPDGRTALMYTVVRASGTPGSDAYETTLSRTEGAPQWADEIADILTSSMLAAAPSGCSGQSAPHVRYCGLAQAPGGWPDRRGVTAVLVEQHGAEGGIGSRHKRARGSINCVMFGWQDAVPPRHEMAVSRPRAHTTTRSGRLTYQRPAVSTEAKMWTYMYGGGPPVEGRPVGQLECSARVAALLSNKASSQRCSICGLVVRGQDAVASVCEAGHRFARCSATGLAIVRPNASHACGVCGSRTMHLGMLLDILKGGAGAGAEAGAAAVDKKDVVALRQEVLGDTCKRCGGKFYD